MTKFKHLNEWEAYSGEDTNGWWIICEKEENFDPESLSGLELGSGDGGFEYEQAHLMAAAPKMYNFLVDIVNHGDKDTLIYFKALQLLKSIPLEDSERLTKTGTVVQ